MTRRSPPRSGSRWQTAGRRYAPGPAAAVTTVSQAVDSWPMDPVRVPTTTDTQTITRMSTADARSGSARPSTACVYASREVVEPDATRGLDHPAAAKGPPTCKPSRFRSMIAADSTGTAWLTIGASTIGALAGITGAWLGSWINQKAQDRRAYDDLRHELVEQMTATAAAFYLQAQMYWRTLDGMLGGYTDLSEARNALDTQYSKSRVEGATLEARLTAYYRSDAPGFSGIK
jgi:hypothetical protein